MAEKHNKPGCLSLLCVHGHHRETAAEHGWPPCHVGNITGTFPGESHLARTAESLKRSNCKEMTSVSSNRAKGGHVRDRPKKRRTGKTEPQKTIEPTTKKPDSVLNHLPVNVEQPRTPVGLLNLENTCYFNAVLQNIDQTVLLRFALNNIHNITNSSIIQGLMNYWRRQSTQTYFNPTALFHALCVRSDRFYGGRQQDSYEALRHLMDGVKEEHSQLLQQGIGLQSSPGPDTRLTVVDRVFGGHSLTIYRCQACNMPYHLFEPFLDISLPIAFKDEERAPMWSAECRDETGDSSCSHSGPEFDRYVNAVNNVKQRLTKTTIKLKYNSVTDCLRFYTRQEQMDEYFCLMCNEGQSEYTMQRATKQTLVFNPPAILTIHLRRFQQKKRGYVKVSTHVAFDMELDLSPFCSRFAWRQQREKNEGSFRYRLYGVVVHGGSLEGGHYTACVRLRTVDVERARTFLQKKFLDRQQMMTKEQLIQLVAEDLPRERLPCVKHQEHRNSEDQWFEISDTSVSKTNFSRVMAKEAYLLFYERVA